MSSFFFLEEHKKDHHHHEDKGMDEFQGVTRRIFSRLVKELCWKKVQSITFMARHHKYQEGIPQDGDWMLSVIPSSMP